MPKVLFAKLKCYFALHQGQATRFHHYQAQKELLSNAISLNFLTIMRQDQVFFVGMPRPDLSGGWLGSRNIIIIDTLQIHRYQAQKELLAISLNSLTMRQDQVFFSICWNAWDQIS